MKWFVAYWFAGCLLVGAAAADRARECGRMPPLTTMAAVVAIWPVAVGAAITAPKDFKFQTTCSQ